MSKAVGNTLRHVLATYPGVDFLGQTVGTCLVLVSTAYQFSKYFSVMYTHPRNIQEPHLLHILVNSWYHSSISLWL